MNNAQRLDRKAHCLESKNERHETNRSKGEEITYPYMRFLSDSFKDISPAEGVFKQQIVEIASWTAVQVFKDVVLHHLGSK